MVPLLRTVPSHPLPLERERAVILYNCIICETPLSGPGGVNTEVHKSLPAPLLTRAPWSDRWLETNQPGRPTAQPDSHPELPPRAPQAMVGPSRGGFSHQLLKHAHQTSDHQGTPRIYLLPSKGEGGSENVLSLRRHWLFITGLAFSYSENKRNHDGA